MNLDGQPTPREPTSRRIVLAERAAGTRLGGYRIERAIGRGGMGQVYLATDERLGRRVALKVLPKEDADDEARARFLREARALARVEHENVVRVFASGDDDGTAWMALDFIQGEPLSSLGGGAPLDEETAVGLMAQVARGLAAVHAVGVVHRDVKPDNLLVDDDATVKIVDFGVAQLSEAGDGGFTTRAGVVVGTPHFMSPEQARGAAVDARSDAWSLGATLFTLLGGRPPFYERDDEPDLDILARVVRDAAPDVRTLAPATSPATASLLQELLSKDPAARPGDLAVVAERLLTIAGALAEGRTPDAVGTSAPSPTTAPASPAAAAAAPVVADARRPPVAAVAGVAVLVAAAVIGGVLLGRGLTEPRVEERVIERVVEVKVPVEVKPPVLPPVAPAPPPKPTPEELAHELAAARPEDLDAAVGALLAREDDDARAALALAARTAGRAGDVVVRRVVQDPRGDRAGVIDAALSSPSRERALLVVSLLQQRRDDTALLTLRRVADEHRDPAVRVAAARARDSIFSVGD